MVRGEFVNASTGTKHDRSPFFKPSTPGKITKVESPGGTVRLKKKATNSDEIKSSVLGTVANLVTTIVGSGIVAIPFAIRESGLVAGTLLITMCAMLTDKSLRLLIETGKHVDVPSYETLMEAAFGRFGFVFISVNMFLTSFGGLVSYLIIIKDTIPLLLGVDIDNEPLKRAILVLASMSISLPISMQRDMASLSKTSVIGAIFDVLMVAIVAFFCPIKEAVAASGGLKHIISHSTVHFDTMFIGLGVLSFAFVCQDSCFIIAGSLDKPTNDRWAKVTSISLFTCGTLSTICGVSGYLAFQQNTEGNILNNFEGPETQIAATAARALLGSTMFFCYPLSSYVVRHVLVVLLFQGRRAHEGNDHLILSRRDRRVALTLVIYVAALVPAIFLNDVGTVLSFAGAIAGSCLSYIGPGCVYLAVHGSAFMTLVRKWFGCGFTSCLFGFPSFGSLGGHVEYLPRRKEYGNESEMTPINTKTAERSLYGEVYHVPDSSTKAISCRGEVIRLIISTLSLFVWYLLLMPVWCVIATVGMKRVGEFRKKQLLNSPGPNCLVQVNGDQSTRRKLIPPRTLSKSKNTTSRSRSVSPTPRKPLRRADSDTAERNHEELVADRLGRLHETPGSFGAGFDHFGAEYESIALAQVIPSTVEGVSAMGRMSSVGDVEDDSQELKPTTGDFVAAAGFIVLGVVAMMVGISSILMNG